MLLLISLMPCFITLQKYPFMDILPEPVDKWTNLDGNDLLELIYTNPKRWGLTQVSNE